VWRDHDGVKPWFQPTNLQFLSLSPFFFLYIYFVSVTEHGLSSGMLMNDAMFCLIMYMKESASIFVHTLNSGFRARKDIYQFMKLTDDVIKCKCLFIYFLSGDPELFSLV